MFNSIHQSRLKSDKQLMMTLTQLMLISISFHQSSLIKEFIVSRYLTLMIYTDLTAIRTIVSQTTSAS